MYIWERSHNFQTNLHHRLHISADARERKQWTNQEDPRKPQRAYNTIKSLRVRFASGEEDNKSHNY